MQRLAAILIPGAVAILGAVAIAAWILTATAPRLEARVPHLDGAPAATVLAAASRTAAGKPVAGPGRPSKIDASWPCFRGPWRDAIAHDSARLARQWPNRGPKRLWSVPLGEGYAAAAIGRGCVYVLDHAHDKTLDLVRGMSQDDRLQLADALAALPLTGGDELDVALQQWFAPAGAGTTTAVAVTRADYESLKRTLAERLAADRDKLLGALRSGLLDPLDRSADVVRCLSLDDGREIWHNGYPVVVPASHGMSRTIPAVVGNYVITFGPQCQVACWDAETGAARWLIDLVLDYGATVPEWYAGQCPLVDPVTDRLILAPGGRALVMAVDYRTGKPVWESPNPRRWTMTHVSILPLEAAGRRMYVYCGKGGVAGIDAADGQILWDTPDWQIAMATCPTPVDIGDGRIFCSGGYNAGSLMLEVAASANGVPFRGAKGNYEAKDDFSARTLWRLSPKQFGSEQQTPVFFGGHLYGVRQKDKKLVCLDLAGREQWTSGSDKFGSAPYLVADGLIYVLDDDGWLTMAEAAPRGYERLGRARVIQRGVECWGPMALAAGRLVVRDMTRMVCLDVAESQ